MSLLIVDVVKELRRCTAELKESNDKWEAKEQMALEQYNLEQIMVMTLGMYHILTKIM